MPPRDFQLSSGGDYASQKHSSVSRNWSTKTDSACHNDELFDVSNSKLQKRVSIETQNDYYSKNHGLSGPNKAAKRSRCYSFPPQEPRISSTFLTKEKRGSWYGMAKSAHQGPVVDYHDDNSNNTKATTVYETGSKIAKNNPSPLQLSSESSTRPVALPDHSVDSSDGRKKSFASSHMSIDHDRILHESPSDSMPASSVRFRRSVFLQRLHSMGVVCNTNLYHEEKKHNNTSTNIPTSASSFPTSSSALSFVSSLTTSPPPPPPVHPPCSSTNLSLSRSRSLSTLLGRTKESQLFTPFWLQNAQAAADAKKSSVCSVNASSDAPEEGEIDLPPEQSALKTNIPVTQVQPSQANQPSQRPPPGYSTTLRRPIPISIDAWTIESVSLSSECLDRLRDGGLLDDSIIEYFFRFLHRYALPSQQSKRIFFFSSYFYSKLIDGGTTPKQRHEAVRRWTNKLTAWDSKNQRDYKRHIWEFDTIVVPLNHTGAHWTLVLVTFPILALRGPKLGSDSLKKESKNVYPFSKHISSNVRTSVSDVEDRSDEEQGNTLSTTKNDVIDIMSLSSSESDVDTNPEKKYRKKRQRQASKSNSDEDFYSVDEVSSSDSTGSYYSALLTEEKNNDFQILQPGIFHLDSLSDTTGSPEQLKEILVSYFQEEFLARCPSLVKKGFFIADATEWVYHSQTPVPVQQNGFDCGIFLIEYVRHLFTNNERIKTLLYECPKCSCNMNLEEDQQRKLHVNSDTAPSSSSSRSLIKQQEKQQDIQLSQWISENWFTQNIVTHRRKILRSMLIYMQKNKDWKTHNEHRQHLINLFNSSPSFNNTTSPNKEKRISDSSTTNSISSISKFFNCKDNIGQPNFSSCESHLSKSNYKQPTIPNSIVSGTTAVDTNNNLNIVYSKDETKLNNPAILSSEKLGSPYSSGISMEKTQQYTDSKICFNSSSAPIEKSATDNLRDYNISEEAEEEQLDNSHTTRQKRRNNDDASSSTDNVRTTKLQWRTRKDEKASNLNSQYNDDETMHAKLGMCGCMTLHQQQRQIDLTSANNMQSSLPKNKSPTLRVDAITKNNDIGSSNNNKNVNQRNRTELLSLFEDSGDEDYIPAQLRVSWGRVQKQ